MEQHRQSEGEQPFDPETWVERYGDVLFRYAWRRVQRPDVAEDLVQETFLAALKARDRFQGKSSERTWLIGILKHKIIDHIRRAGRKRSTETGPHDEDRVTALFDGRGQWAQKPSAWHDGPEQQLVSREFLGHLESCLAQLPQRLAHAFSLRHLEELDGSEASRVMGVSANNLGVLLYRARQRIRRCLEAGWLG